MTHWPYTKDDNESKLCMELVGMSYEDAVSVVKDRGYEHRIVRRDGVEADWGWRTLEAHPSGIGLEVNGRHVVSAFPHKATGNWSGKWPEWAS